MHICCANCSLYPLKTLFSKGIDVKGLWFNPNIHPYTEYRMRLDSLQKLQNVWGLDIEYIDHYGLKEFLRAVVNREDNRCISCYSMRLEETAKTAKKMGLEGFTTSLLVSPYQKFDMIINVGKEMGKRYSIPFYFEDFRFGWKDGISLSKELGLYRQKYCGCVYSEMERYLKK
jgi:predicted adenine nucleotide alpha hydrolase (AANH) superfamily ATPase